MVTRASLLILCIFGFATALHGRDKTPAEQIRDREPGALLIYLDAPSPAVQEQRLRQRGDTDEQIQARLAHAASEQAAGQKLGATVVVNDQLDDTVAELHRLIVASRHGPGEQPPG